MKSYRTGKRGFTLLEVMLAIGIFSMVLVSIYSVWTSILRAAKATRSAADAAQRARISIRAFENALVTAQMFAANMPPQNRDAYYSFLADSSGDFTSLSFVAHLPASFPGVGRYGDHVVRRVTFTVEQGKEGLDLVMRQAPLMAAAFEGSEEVYSLVLAKDVQMFIVEFWGQQREDQQWAWVPEWNSTNALPKLVRVALGIGSTGRQGVAQDVVTRVIALPATAVQPDWQLPGGFGVPAGQGNRPVGRQPPGGGGSRTRTGTGVGTGGTVIRPR